LFRTSQVAGAPLVEVVCPHCEGLVRVDVHPAINVAPAPTLPTPPPMPSTGKPTELPPWMVSLTKWTDAVGRVATRCGADDAEILTCRFDQPDYVSQPDGRWYDDREYDNYNNDYPDEPEFYGTGAEDRTLQFARLQGLGVAPHLPTSEHAFRGRRANGGRIGTALCSSTSACRSSLRAPSRARRRALRRLPSACATTCSR